MNYISVALYWNSQDIPEQDLHFISKNTDVQFSVSISNPRPTELYVCTFILAAYEAISPENHVLIKEKHQVKNITLKYNTNLWTIILWFI